MSMMEASLWTPLTVNRKEKVVWNVNYLTSFTHLHYSEMHHVQKDLIDDKWSTCN